MTGRAQWPGTFVVTGAAGGIGAAIVAELFEHGAHVVAVDLNAPDSTSAARFGHRYQAIAGDVTDEAVVGAAFDAATRADLPLGGLVTCAFAEERRLLDEAESTGFRRTVEVLLVASWRWGVELTRRLDGAAGAIVHVASIHAERTLPGFGAYAAAKAGLLSLTRSMAVEWGPRGVRTNAVAPGMVAVERNRSAWADDRGRTREGAGSPLGRWATPADVANAVRFLLSPDASAITGVSLPVDAGRLAVLNEVAQ